MADAISNEILAKGIARHQWLREEISRLEAEDREMIKLIQGACEHPAPLVVEGAYSPNTEFSYYSPSFRVCTRCGYSEEEYSFSKLGQYPADQIRKWGRDEARKMCVGHTLTHEELSDISCAWMQAASARDAEEEEREKAAELARMLSHRLTRKTA